MPTKRRPLKHQARIGELVITPRMIAAHRRHQDACREHGRWSAEAGRAHSEVQLVMNFVPWDDVYEQDLQVQQLHELVYPDPATRPRRLGGIRGNPLIAQYGRESRR